jgi:predicted amidohydrolase YtcJ
MKNIRINLFAPLVLLLVATTGCSEKAAEPSREVADRVFLNGVVYTADAQQQVASALALRAGKIIYVGDDAGVQAYIGGDTVVADIAGKMLLPGLHDMHIHPAGIVDTEGCDLQSEALNLTQIAAAVAACIASQTPAPGEWLSVAQWSFTNGNQPSVKLQNLRQALDVGAPNNPVILWGNDGHHGAVNSLGLARAVSTDGKQIGISAATISTDFAEYRDTIGVDARGEPNGELHETARKLVNPPQHKLLDGLSVELMPRVAAKLASNGITSIQDAAAPPSVLPYYRNLAESGQMTFNLSAALFQNVADFETAGGGIDVPAMLAELDGARREFNNTPHIQVNTVKVFVDGVIEGNPLNDPPTLPNAAVLNPYQQPLFEIDFEAGEAEVVGYVDVNGEACQQARVDEAVYADPAKAEAYRSRHGYFPSQCRISRGVLENPQDFILDYMAAVDKAGFNIHAHVIGDRAVRTALDGFDRAEQENGKREARHSLGHIQLVAPEDYQRIGDHGLYLVFTYAWITVDPFYDLTVIPFVNPVQGMDGMYDPASYYIQNAYPARQLQTAGAHLAGGSDAPVDTREPRPFFNIQQAVTRAGTDGRVMNPAGALDIRGALDAYTIDGARLFGHDADTGSLEVGKNADLVLIDRDLLALTDNGRASEIGATQVLLTVFEGRTVFEAP